MAPHTLPRQENPATTKKYLTVGLIAGSLCFVVLLCLLCLLRFRRSKANRKRIAERSAASFHVRGVIRPTMAETNPFSTKMPPPSNQYGLPASTVAPEKSTCKPLSHGLFDKAVALSQFEPSPASSTLSLHRPPSATSSGAPRPFPMSIRNPPCPRHSRSSSGFTIYAQYSLPPGLNIRPTSTISTYPSQAKYVHQHFEPALPDELALVRYGEYLRVLQSFSDGWCLVARDTSRSSRASRLSALTRSNGDNVDIGLVPAWVFTKPLEGVAATRPFRVESINVLHLGRNPAYATSRHAIISGTDFA